MADGIHAWRLSNELALFRTAVIRTLKSSQIYNVTINTTTALLHSNVKSIVTNVLTIQRMTTVAGCHSFIETG